MSRISMSCCRQRRIADFAYETARVKYALNVDNLLNKKYIYAARNQALGSVGGRIVTIPPGLRKEQVALIHAHEFSAILCGWVVAMLAGVPLVATVHGKNYFWEKLRRRVTYRLVSRQGTIVAVSQDLKQFICDRVGVQEQRVEVIYNGVAPAQMITDEEAQACKTELGISGCYPVLGVVGSLYPVKGHRFLLEALPEILRRWPKAQLLVIGRGELDVVLKEQVEQLAIGANVHFLGMRQDVPRLLSLMDVFVLPSLSEGLSLALLEAMASGKPVVATRVGGNPELIDHGRTGLLVQSEDAKDLAANLLTLLSDSGTMQQLGRQACQQPAFCTAVVQSSVESEILRAYL